MGIISKTERKNENHVLTIWYFGCCCLLLLLLPYFCLKIIIKKNLVLMCVDFVVVIRWWWRCVWVRVLFFLYGHKSKRLRKMCAIDTCPHITFLVKTNNKHKIIHHQYNMLLRENSKGQSLKRKFCFCFKVKKKNYINFHVHFIFVEYFPVFCSDMWVQDTNLYGSYCLSHQI